MYFFLSLVFMVNNNDILNIKNPPDTLPQTKKKPTKIRTSGRIERCVMKLPLCLYLQDALSSGSFLVQWRKKCISVASLASSQPNSSVIKKELSHWRGIWTSETLIGADVRNEQYLVHVDDGG